MPKKKEAKPPVGVKVVSISTSRQGPKFLFEKHATSAVNLRTFTRIITKDAYDALELSGRLSTTLQQATRLMEELISFDEKFIRSKLVDNVEEITARVSKDRETLQALRSVLDRTGADRKRRLNEVVTMENDFERQLEEQRRRELAKPIKRQKKTKASENTTQSAVGMPIATLEESPKPAKPVLDLRLLEKAQRGLKMNLEDLPNRQD
jgi:hypothetical protein